VTTPMGFTGIVSGTVVLGPLSVDGGAPARLGDAGLWVASGTPDPTQRRPFAQPVDAGDPTRVGLQVQTFGDEVRISSAGTAAPVPALVLGPLPSDAPGPGFQAAGLDGTTVEMLRVGSVPYAPGGGTNEAVVSLEALARRTNEISPQASAQVFVADASSVPAVQNRLRQAGITVRSVALRTDRAQLFDRSASAWGLRLALVVGLAALAIAALVLVLVGATSWRGRSRDFAALRMAGVSTRSLTRVSLAEQWVVVVVSVVAGAVCGLLGAWLAMPIVPFFTLPSAVLPVDLTPAAGPALLTAVAALLALLLVGLVVGLQLVSRASMARVRDQL
jgi:putative ABC transport system permease protein